MNACQIPRIDPHTLSLSFFMLIRFTPIKPKMEEEEKEEERRQLVSETNDPKDRSAASSFLWRGLRLGKKVALAGAAISTAPVVIPPLIVGLAFAFPFGVYIAGITCTDKVMRALLSTPPDLVMADGRDEEEEEEDIEMWPPTATLDDITQEEEEGERGEIEMEMPRIVDHSLAAVERTGNDLGIETSARQMIVFIGDDEVPGGMVEGGKAKKEAESTEKEHDEVDGDELAPVTAEHDIELWPPISDLHIPREEGNNIEGPGTGDERCVEEVRDRTKELVHCSLAAVPEEREVDFKLPSLNTEHALSASGAGTEAVVDGKIMKGVGTKEMNGTDKVEMNRQDGMGRQIESNYVVEQSAVDWNRIERGVETLGQTVEYEKDEGGVMGERNTGNCRSVATPEENVIAIYHSFASVAPLESESQRVPSSLTSEYASAVEDQSTGMTDNASRPTAIIVETAGVVNFDNEVLYSEEMIWEQIYAMRTIVGYKSVLNSSLVEELKALYLFTGVEPPISLRDTSDVMEIGDKLDFLKSVIGVK